MFKCCVSTEAAEFYDYIIVGGGNAAGYACKEFVEQGISAGSVAVISAEPGLPYERPALTKAYLHPPSAKVRARLPGFLTCVGGGGERQTEEFYRKHGISIVHGRVTSVDVATRRVIVDSENVFSYGKLILATGCRTRKLGIAGDNMQGVHYLRDEQDAASLVTALEAAKPKSKAVVVGGGYIGLECTAALLGWDLDVTVVDLDPRPLARLFDAGLSSWIENEYTTRGAQFLKGESVVEFVPSSTGAIGGVRLQSGVEIGCDLVIVGVGSVPNAELMNGALRMAGGGFAVDASMRTSDPNIFAIGDICAFPSQYGGGERRCEHVDHARKSAAQAVKAAMGKSPDAYVYTPYFYSRVFEYTDAPIVFNFFGDDSGAIKTTRRGTKSIGAIWVKEGKVVGALLMGSPGPSADDASKLKAMIAAGPPADSVEVVFQKFDL